MRRQVDWGLCLVTDRRLAGARVPAGPAHPKAADLHGRLKMEGA